MERDQIELSLALKWLMVCADKLESEVVVLNCLIKNGHKYSSAAAAASTTQDELRKAYKHAESCWSNLSERTLATWRDELEALRANYLTVSDIHVAARHLRIDMVTSESMRVPLHEGALLRLALSWI